MCAVYKTLKTLSAISEKASTPGALWPHLYKLSAAVDMVGKPRYTLPILSRQQIDRGDDKTRSSEADCRNVCAPVCITHRQTWVAYIMKGY